SPNLAPDTFKNSTASSQFSPKISNQGLRYLFFKKLMVCFLLLKKAFGQKRVRVGALSCQIRIS
ncbi:hypothetical protein EC575_21205, partial [Vibrio cholerae]